jgi:His-Xaa-Ser system radical SAM maturase HxsC
MNAMLKLHAHLNTRWTEAPYVVRINTTVNPHLIDRHREALLLSDGADERPDGYRVYFAFTPIRVPPSPRCIELPDSLRYLAEGDIVRVIPRTGDVAVLYRKTSPFNYLLVTERCNSNCVMCSQPPKDIDDGYLAVALLQAIPLMDRATAEVGITGGEPTLLGDRLIEIIAACKEHLPNTAVHVLSNGRLFNYLSLCGKVAAIGHRDLMIGIPLYSDIAWRHDFVVQARGAFDQTIRGIINLKRVDVKVELRVVLHRQTVDRLPDLARFISRNLGFVDHVALMGLEMMGYVKMNLDALWIDPFDYQSQLVDAVRQLVRSRLNVSIYNHQLCVLDRELWPFARKSISDWKNEYLEPCDTCSAKPQCGGFFTSSKLRFSDHIAPISSIEKFK